MNWFRTTASAAFLACVAVTLLSPRAAVAGPPFVIDDPDPVDFQHFEINLFALYGHTAGADAGDLPAADINYGALPDLHLHLQPLLVYSKPPGSPAHYGIGDTEAGFKYRFFHETDWLPEVAVYPLFEIPTGSQRRGLGNGRLQIFAPLWFQKSWGDDKAWTAYGGGGYWYNPGDDHRDYIRFGAVLQRQLTQRLALGSEIYHETPSQSTPASMGVVTQHRTLQIAGVQGHTAFNLGGTFNLDEHYHILFSAGRDIDGPTRFQAYLALQLEF